MLTFCSLKADVFCSVSLLTGPFLEVVILDFSWKALIVEGTKLDFARWEQLELMLRLDSELLSSTPC